MAKVQKAHYSGVILCPSNDWIVHALHEIESTFILLWKRNLNL